jgi:hypothetical protein
MGIAIAMKHGAAKQAIASRTALNPASRQPTCRRRLNTKRGFQIRSSDRQRRNAGDLSYCSLSR